MLIQPSEESVVMHILHKPLSPVELIKVSQTHMHVHTHTQSINLIILQALSSVGYYFFPEADAEKYTSLTSKV